VKDSCPSPTKMLKHLSKWKPTKTLKERAQQRSIDEVVFAKWKRNKTIPRHTAARIRCLPQQISILPVRKKSGDEYEPTTRRGIIASVERYLQNLYATAKDDVWQLNCSRGSCLSEFLNLETTLWFSLCAGFHNERRVATLPNLRMIIFGLIDKCYSSHNTSQD